MVSLLPQLILDLISAYKFFHNGRQESGRDTGEGKSFIVTKREREQEQEQEKKKGV